MKDNLFLKSQVQNFRLILKPAACKNQKIAKLFFYLLVIQVISKHRDFDKMKSLEICDTRKEALAILMKGRKERKVSLPTSLASLRILPKRYTENKVNTLSGLGKQFITDREKALLQMIEHLLPNCEEKITLHDLKNSRTLFVKILYWSKLQLHIIRGS